MPLLANGFPSPCSFQTFPVSWSPFPLNVSQQANTALLPTAPPHFISHLSNYDSCVQVEHLHCILHYTTSAPSFLRPLFTHCKNMEVIHYPADPSVLPCQTNKEPIVKKALPPIPFLSLTSIVSFSFLFLDVWKGTSGGNQWERTQCSGGGNSNYYNSWHVTEFEDIVITNVRVCVEYLKMKWKLVIGKSSNRKLWGRSYQDSGVLWTPDLPHRRPIEPI